MSEPTTSNQLQVWCDVGGTFTDCFVSFPDGSRRCTKVLSSGRVKGFVHTWIDKCSFIDTSRIGEPPDFWTGAKLRWIDIDGQIVSTLECTHFDNRSGALTLGSTVNANMWEASQEYHPSSEAFQRYELDCGLLAPVLATRLLLSVAPNEALPDLNVRLGTTRGTNALLTRQGEPVALVTTLGFADLLHIGYQERPDLFALHVRKRAPLYRHVIEVEERMAADGSVHVPLNRVLAETMLRELYASGIRSIAICLLHSYVNPEHELIIERIAERIGFSCICVSSRIASKIKAVTRAETAVVDAYLTPVIQEYLTRLRQEFGIRGEHGLRVMTSGGGLVSSNIYRGKDCVLSGPAGGAVAIEAYAQALGIPKCIGLDMGGTSTDVCRVDGQMQLEQETIKAGVRMMVPTLSIHTVAAGGGSICWFDGVQLRVGPQSAGSDPGPACYGRGGPLTITDLNLLSYRIDEVSFPFHLDRTASARRLQELLDQVHQKDAHGLVRTFSFDELCQGFRRIANEHMAAAVRSISIAQGADPREHALLGFGGAAGQHLCEIADLLEMDRVLDPPDAGLLSALGMGMATVRRNFMLPLYRECELVCSQEWQSYADSIRNSARTAFENEGMDFTVCCVKYFVEVKYVGTEGAIIVPLSEEDLYSAAEGVLAEKIAIRFDSMHRAKFGYARTKRLLEVVCMQVEVQSKRENAIGCIERINADSMNLNAKTEIGSRKVYLRSSLEPGQTLHGPILVVSSGSSTFVEGGWIAEVLSDRTLLMVRSHPLHDSNQAIANSDTSKLALYRTHAPVDPVLREVLAQRIAAIAEQMGIVLEQTAISVNVKDRRDFSCAVFSNYGDLIANAPHVPVHLGAMSQTVRCMLKQFPKMLPGDCFVTNDPYRGGSHLPDVTVITPVFVARESSNEWLHPDFFVACRAHHAEIGGISPGSMAPTSRRLIDEGVILPSMYMTKAGEDCSEEVRSLLQSGPYPSRAVDENMADLAAQQAANQRGALAMQELAKSYGLDTVTQYLEHIQSASEAKTRAWIESLGKVTRRFHDCMDDGTSICVSVTPVLGNHSKWSLEVDFSGSGPVSTGNLNANPAIVTAAVMYVIRCAIADSLPLNSGVMRCVELVIPEGILNPPSEGKLDERPAVAGGNVETSQRVVDCLLGALGLAAASQGTMNNFLFGDATFGYYETIGGGTGATRQGNGEDAVHCHMTNTRLTDVEVLERHYPVRLIRFEIRKESGGKGLHCGGNGMIRQIQALRRLEVSLVTSRRKYAPFGLDGGLNGKAGENWLIQANGDRILLDSSVQLSIEPGDSILLETPGGGGFGQAQ